MELLLINGRIYTMNRTRDVYEGLAVKDGRIVQLGKTDDILSLRTDATRIIDLRGNIVIPGFNDSHMHLLSYGYSQRNIKLDGCASLRELKARVKYFIQRENIQAGQWVEGRGWDQNLFDVKEIPNRYDLDQISLEIPIVLGRTCGQMCIANTKALALLETT